MRQRKQKRLTAWLLTLIMAVSLFPGLGLNAQAVEEESPDPPAVTETTVTPEQTETGTPESPAETEPPEDPILTEGQTVSQPAMPAATGDAHLKVIMDNGQTLYLYHGNTIKKHHSGDYYTEAVTNRPSIYVACLKKTAQYQWTLELNNFNGQSITYVPGDNHANSVVLSLGGDNVLAPKDGYAVDANQHNYRAISCGKETDNGGIPLGLSFIIEGSGSLAIHANDRNTAYQMETAQCIFTKGLTIRGDAKVSIDLKLPSYESDKSHTIFTSNLYVFDNASLDIKSYNVGEVVRASAHDKGGKSFIRIDTTGTVNVEFGCDGLESTYPRVFCGYPDSTICVYSIDKVGYMSIARNGYRTDNDNDPDRFDFVASPGITVSEDVTVKTFTSDHIKRIQYFPRLAAAVRVQLFDGRIQDGKFKPYDELWGPLKDKSVDITITAPESAAPFDRWSTITDDLTAEDPGADLPVNGQPVSNETVTLHITGAGRYLILAKYDPFGGTPKWTKGYSPAANCTTGTVSWTAPDSMKDVKGMLVPATFQLSGSSPVAATDKSGNDIKDVVSGGSVFAKQSGSGITYALSDTGAKRVALNFDGRWHFSETFVPDLDDLELPPAPELVSLNCSGGETPLLPGAAAAYPFARGLIVKATNFDSDQYEMYYTFNNGGTHPGDPTGTSPSASNGVIVLKSSDTWSGVTHLRVRFKSKTTGAWSPTTRIPLQKILESQSELYEVTFAPEENYTLKGSTVTITDSITATVTKANSDQWPINAELVYHTKRLSPSTNYVNYTEGTPIPFDPDTIAASGETAAYLRVGVRVPDPVNSSTDYSVIRKSDIDIKLPESYKLFLWDCTATVDGKPAANNSNVAVGKTVILTPTVPQGYTFKGWNFPDGLAITDLGNGTYSFTMPKQDVTIKAILYAQEYTSMTVIFDVYSGSSIVSNMSDIRHTVSGVNGATTEITFYKGKTPYNNGALDKDSGCYRAHITCSAAENAIFSDSMELRANCKVNSSNGQLLKGGFILSADKKTLEFDVWLVFAPEVTVPLYEGESTPTAAQCTTLPGIKVDSLTWSGNTIEKMVIKDQYVVGDSCSLFRLAGNPKVWINGVLYDATYSLIDGEYALTVTNKTIPTVSKGVTVSGTVTSYGSDSDDVTVQLIEAGHTEPAYEAIVSGNSATYSFDTVPAGTYTLKVMKKGHAPFAKEITVGGSNVTEDVTVYLIGDVNGDGAITADDLTALARHVAKISIITDTAALARCDVTKDGSVTADDLTMLARYVAKIISSFA